MQRNMQYLACAYLYVVVWHAAVLASRYLISFSGTFDTDKLNANPNALKKTVTLDLAGKLAGSVRHLSHDMT